MQKNRQINGWTGKRVAEEFGCSPSHISRVEHGAMPSRQLVQFYEEAFGADGLLLPLFEVAVNNAEQDRRRSRGRRITPGHALLGDASEFVDDTIPHGTLMRPGEVFTKVWRVRNSGTVLWVGRRLERPRRRVGVGDERPVRLH